MTHILSAPGAPLWRTLAGQTGACARQLPARILDTLKAQPLAAIVIGLALLAFGLFHPPAGLSAAGWGALSVFSVAVLLWMTNLTPPHITSALVVGALLLLGVSRPEVIGAAFTHHAVLFLIGAFMLGTAVKETRLSEVLALSLIHRAGSTPARLPALIFAMGLLASFVVQEHVVVAVMFPIVLSLADDIAQIRPGSRYPAFLLVAMAWGAVIGGIATYLGGNRALIADAILHQASGASIGFWELAAIGAPLALALGVAGYGVLRLFFPIDVANLDPALDALSEAHQREEPPSARGRRLRTAIVLTVVLTLWLTLSKQLTLEGIALMGVVGLIALRCVSVSTLLRKTNWRIILIYGGALALSFSLNQTDALRWLEAHLHEAVASFSPQALTGVFSAIALFVTELMNNSAAVSSFLPIALPLGVGAGLSPKLATLAVALSSGLSFILPTSTTAIALILSTPHVRVRQLLAPGVLLKGLSCGMITLWLLYLKP
ncbi:MAG: anion permease [Vampirovibrionales bacterium]|nr:anion permease [Vampirovibrionales bacterium]